MRQKEIGVGLVTWIDKMIRLIIISKYHQIYWQLPNMFNALCVCVVFTEIWKEMNGKPFWCELRGEMKNDRKGKQLRKKIWKKNERKNTTDNSTKFIILFYVWRLNLWNSICFCSSDFFFFVHLILPVNRMWAFRQNRVCACMWFQLKTWERTYSMINWFLILIENRPKLASYQSIVYHLLFGRFRFKCRHCPLNCFVNYSIMNFWLTKSRFIFHFLLRLRIRRCAQCGKEFHFSHFRASKNMRISSQTNKILRSARRQSKKKNHSEKWETMNKSFINIFNFYLFLCLKCQKFMDSGKIGLGNVQTVCSVLHKSVIKSFLLSCNVIKIESDIKSVLMLIVWCVSI